jgi:hypothetical protein
LIFGLIHCRDGDLLQWPAAMRLVLCSLVSIALTAADWLLVVPLSIWFARRSDRSIGAEKSDECPLIDQPTPRPSPRRTS